MQLLYDFGEPRVSMLQSRIIVANLNYYHRLQTWRVLPEPKEAGVSEL